MKITENPRTFTIECSEIEMAIIVHRMTTMSTLGQGHKGLKVGDVMDDMYSKCKELIGGGNAIDWSLEVLRKAGLQ